ncbi:hypothetical protein AMTRI_Chr06g178270 [Amborella trichopoda]
MEECIEGLVREMKGMMVDMDVYSCVFSSAYDTACLAMLPSEKSSKGSMFPKCLQWIIENQRVGGFWGEGYEYNSPTIESLPSTFACIIALKSWNVGHECIEKGLEFIHGNINKLLLEQSQLSGAQRFTIILPAMIELANSKGLEIFPKGVPDLVKSVFKERDNILQREGNAQALQAPLLHHLEALPLHLMDREFTKLLMVDLLENLGLGEYFTKEIQEMLGGIYKMWMEKGQGTTWEQFEKKQICMDSLAFRLLRMHGYNVSPSRFCWYLDNMEIRSHVEENYEEYLSSMLSVYKASHLMFDREIELEKARSFSKMLLEKAMSNNIWENFSTVYNLQDEIKYELRVPWLARLDHLVHRRHIERFEEGVMLWMGNGSYFRLPSRAHNILEELAKRNYSMRQSMYRDEIEKLERWVRKSGIQDLGFARQKTTYCFFASAAAICEPNMSLARMSSAKSGILVTVIDDFFDIHGSMDELQSFTDAIERWNGGGLTAHAKVLFCALDDHINTIAKQAFHQQARDITDHLRQIWYKAIKAWLKEAEWIRNSYIPSVEEYREVAMESIGLEQIVLPGVYLVGLEISNEIIHHDHHKKILELVTLSTRLLNDMQSYEREIKECKPNFVSLLLRQNRRQTTQDVIDNLKKILDQKERRLLEKLLIEEENSLPSPCRKIHLRILKIFQMFYNGTNVFDSPTQLLGDINKAIYKDITSGCASATQIQPMCEPICGSCK